MSDPFAELRARLQATDARVRTLEQSTSGNTQVGLSPWAEAVQTTTNETGNVESDVSAAKLTMGISTPVNRKLRFLALATFAIAQNGGASGVLSLTLRSDGVRIAIEQIGAATYALPYAVSFDVAELAPGLHTYTLGWIGSDPLNVRSVVVGPAQTASFTAETRP